LSVAEPSSGSAFHPVGRSGTVGSAPFVRAAENIPARVRPPVPDRPAGGLPDPAGTIIAAATATVG